uniref:Uncharacterized protein n=1 Tax=Prevotella sp. GTC17259 TaxID=3236795 RepID=A0AB33J7Q2_9BACT
MEKACEKKEERKQSVSPVAQEQIEQARQMLIGKSKSYGERHTELSGTIKDVSSAFPKVPDTSSEKNPAEKPGTFAGEDLPVSEETEDTEGTGEENEMQIDYTMDEPDEDSIVREELQIADAVMPEVSPSAILARDLARVTGWHNDDDALDGEKEAEVRDTLQSIRGTQLMDYIKEATLKQEKDHQKLLAAIRKAEEAELQEGDISSSTNPEMDSDVVSGNNNVSKDTDRPLSYYL